MHFCKFEKSDILKKKLFKKKMTTLIKVSPLKEEFHEPQSNANVTQLENESVPSKIEKIKNLFKNDLRTELFEVISKIFNTPHIGLKFYLFLFIAGSSCLASYMVIETIFAYFEYKVITTSRTIFETPTLFPKITICNTNMFQTAYARALLAKANQKFEPKVTNSNLMKQLNMGRTNNLI